MMKTELKPAEQKQKARKIEAATVIVDRWITEKLFTLPDITKSRPVLIDGMDYYCHRNGKFVEAVPYAVRFHSEECRARACQIFNEVVAALPVCLGRSDYTYEFVADQAEDKIAALENNCRLIRSFILSNRTKLDGLHYEVDCCADELKLTCSTTDNGKYLGAPTAKEIAGRWPEVKWKVKVPSWKKDTQRDWVAEISGVTVRIETAVRLIPEPVNDLPNEDSEVELVEEVLPG